MKPENQIPDIASGPLSSKALFELRLFSTCIFVFAALLMQFLLTIYTTILLKIFSISFQYRLFEIKFLVTSNAQWSAPKVCFVFGSGPLILSSIGFALMSVLKEGVADGWKTRLTLTWIAFLMVYSLPCGIVAGAFLFDGFGKVFPWLIESFIVRAMIALVVLVILVTTGGFWRWLFLNSAYNAAFAESESHQNIFIRNVYIKPYIYGFIILLFFNWPYSTVFWPIFLLILGFVPVLHQSSSYQPIYIAESENRIFTTRFQVLYFAILLALIWAAGTFLKIDF